MLSPHAIDPQPHEMSLLSRCLIFSTPPNNHRDYLQTLARCPQISSPCRLPRVPTTEPHLSPSNAITDGMVQSSATTPSWLPFGSPKFLDPQELRLIPEASSTRPENVQALNPAPDLLSGRPMVPTCAGDWESRKRTIGELYMDQNMILNEVIEIMLTKYKFKATQVFIHCFPLRP